MKPPTPKPKTGKLPKTVVKKLTKMFRVIDHYEGEPAEFVRLVYEASDLIYKHHVEPVAVCSNGCSSCCYVPVQLSKIEAQYIEEKTGIKAENLTNSNLLMPDQTPCSFLKNNNCSIYEFRPLNCRVFASMDSPDYCKQGGDVSHWINTVESSPALKHLSGLLLFASTIPGAAQYADIRQWFGRDAINVKNV